jgi:UDP-GlcNAc:undecaprenyl-phosphate/decaprenyl-phosphate GlcNAc-1-phosphate transferase
LSAALPLLLLGLPILDTATVMLTRLRSRRSPFSADRNHLHHRLLALGFTHREAVILLYLAQVGLVLLAYFMRFEADWEVVLAFVVFAATVLGLLRWATRSGWRMGHAEEAQGLRRYLRTLAASEALSLVAVTLMSVGLGVYAVTVLASHARVGADLGSMCLAILVVLVLMSTFKAERSLQWFERAAAYVSIVLLVYLDQTLPHKPPLLTALWWSCVAVIGVAAVVRFWVSSARRFELTAFDLIVIFIALVLPNLPDSVPLPPDLPGGVAKALVLLYAVELLFTIGFKSLVPRVFLGVTLAILAARAFLGVGY